MLERLLPSVEPQYFLEWTRTSFKLSVVEFYTIPLQVALEMLELGICSSV